MDNRRHIHHSVRHFGFSYPTSIGQRLHAAFAPLVTVAVVLIALSAARIFPFVTTNVSLGHVGAALGATLVRLVVSYALALVISIPLALLVVKSPLMERIFLPVFDIAQSVPALAFFPVVIIFFVRLGFTDAAAIFIIFLSMLWNLVFSLVGGLKTVPSDIKSAAHVFGIRGMGFVRRILLPAVVPYLVTGSLLAWAQGWNIIIVAEVLTTYLPASMAIQNPFGIGSMLVNASASGQNGLFVVSILAMVFVIAIMNFFIWQKLLRYAERFKFE